ncbi:MAG TPA: hypothetical protein VIT88_10930 [Pyrinomonadaceae bacterium]
MKNERGPTPESFEILLQWLDLDRDRAAERYEKIRQRLMRALIRAGCADEADRLADEIFDRVGAKLIEKKVPEPFVGDKAFYFHGFVNNVCHEHLRNRKRQEITLPVPADEDVEIESACLDECISTLDEADRRLVLKYYRFDKTAKIEYRRKLAKEFGLSLAGLRTRRHRICHLLRPCIQTCLEGRQWQ